VALGHREGRIAMSSAVVWCLIAAGLLVTSAGLPLFYVLRTRGRVRAMTRNEIVNRMMRSDPSERPDYATGVGVGVRVEASIGIDALRNAAKRGDWKLFWCWPLIMFGFGFGLQMLFIACASYFHQPVFALAAALVCVPFGLSGWFMAWAALYTNIDAGTDTPTDSNSGVQR
jgi:hypothetical protein